ncbi:hypothetical protein HHL28_05360 [Aerophototrophica crusticola]|uniref:Uncharacterized protein n=1 Tax=Aerophototrophica crusticola TaxID=1709002 RepID=A0A858R5M4_9PROT|nr:hypothetical protein HHL28_05360 [Rhodospirillaceae bacterium B3]
MGWFDTWLFDSTLLLVFMVGVMLGVRRLMQSYGETQSRAIREMAESIRTLHRQQNENRAQLLALAAANARLRDELETLRGRPAGSDGPRMALPPKPRYLN